MAYSATIGSYKKAIVEMLNMVDISYASATGTVVSKVFAKYEDWTDITNVDLGFYFGSAGGHQVTLRVYKNSVEIYNVSYAGTGAYAYAKSTAVPVAYKNYGLCEVSLVSDTIGDTVFIRDFKMMRRDI